MSEDDETRVTIPRDLVIRTTDDRGQITLGNEYADCEVTVAVIEVDD